MTKNYFAMLEDSPSEEEIWEYKSKRKPKPVHPNKNSGKISKSVEKATDGTYQSKRKRNKKRPVDAQETVKVPEMCLGEAISENSVVSGQNCSGEDSIPQSQQEETTPRKHRRTPRNKQATPKSRPVYDGYCPNCQMPFSSLLGQTPRWHVFECLDSPPASDIECPDGLLCTSTIPSHYKRYTHFLLARSRASRSPPSSSSHLATLASNHTDPDLPCSFEEKWSLCQKQTEDVKNVLAASSRVTPPGVRSPSAAEKLSSLTNSPRPQQIPLFTELANNDKRSGVGWRLADEVDSPHNSQQRNAPLLEKDVSNDEISYSPLQSEEEADEITRKLDDSQQELFFTESSKDDDLEDNGSPWLKNLPCPLLLDQEKSPPEVNSFLNENECNQGLSKCNTRIDSSPLLFQSEGDDPAETEGDFLSFPAALVRGLNSQYQTTGTKTAEFPSPQSNKQKQAIRESADDNQHSLPLLKSEMAFESQGGGCQSFPPTQSRIRESPSKPFSTKNSTSACSCRKAVDGVQNRKVPASSREKLPSTPTASKSLQILSSGKAAADQPTKAMKQMDIGVYFGLPPKKKEEQVPGESAFEGRNSDPVASPNEKRSRQYKRKAEKSLSDIEFDAKNLNESCLELSNQRLQRQRKRRKKSDLVPGRENQKSDHLMNEAELEAVSLGKDKVQIKSTCGRPQRRNMKTAESYNTGELRKRTCPFYKKIPGTGFSVDAFQYGPIEGCTAYFLTHFHSDHYAGLSKAFTFPVYCSQITGNLLKSKLHVQEQYIHALPMNTECIVNGVSVVLLDANHCPGAVMILFHLPNGLVILHTGDFRADPSMERSLLATQKVHTLYLDTTYCSPEYAFPSQQEVIQFAINTAFETVTLNPRVLVVCGTYSIGKEKVFLAIADVLGSKVGMCQEKYKTLQCLNIPEMNSLITTDMSSSLVHLLPMMHINFKGLQKHLKRFDGKYDQILAFRPTGWTHSNKLTSMADVTPQTKGNISIYGIPYSEHSSYTEMKRFVQWLKPKKIIPTVNVGTFNSRSTMEKYFREWKLEAGY
ncbi:DNA cross-link repair 1A protein [Sorex araneus]|uniref:DNA cross-link repair 1A protein n=1 Tax=Sorex araneus TaxID=42254 RepID=UPI002433F2D4|nr:DNA cross-link repair 1A protein [Sorex araneus]XP_054975009.1 DNA cross-link repair 1A protein [Sorex araneus]XP_054975010.1 DNA cross-link repair 1A protein [Sorex araneus]